MKIAEIRTMNDTEIQQLLLDLHEELFNLRFQYATHQLSNHARMRVVRRDIARIMTLLRARELMDVEA